MRLANKVAIIRRSGRGIGREIARWFAALGTRAVVADVDRQGARAVSAAVRAAHPGTVNAIAPGPVVTPMSNGTPSEATRKAYPDRIPLRRYGTENEIAAALLLASDEASFVTGHTLNGDGGLNAAGLPFDPEEQPGNGHVLRFGREEAHTENGRR